MTEAVFLERPSALWLGLGLAALVVLAAGRGAWTGSTARRRAALVMRVLGVFLASVAAAGPRRDLAPDRPRELLVATGPEGHGEFPLPERGEEVILRKAPTAARAIALALGARDPRADARLLCILDPREPDPEGAAAALRRAAEAGVPVLLRMPGPEEAPPPAPPREAPWLEGLALPAGLSAGVPFTPRPLLVEGAGEAVVEILVDGSPLGTWTAAGPALETTLSAGPHLLAARAKDGRGRDRGTVSAVVTVPGAARVLVIEEGARPSPLAEALALQGLPVTRAQPGGPLPDPGTFTVVVLGAGARGDAALEAAVRRGTGLLVAGHPEDARGLGRFRGSPLAAALPVFLPPPPPPAPPPELPPDPPPEPEAPPPEEGPSVRVEEGERPGAVVSLFLVLDVSGSMTGMKMEMARRAAAAAAATLDPRDRFALITFAGEPRWEIPPGPAGDDGRILRALRALRPGGLTDLLPALREVGRALAAESTAVRHVIVLSDGETSPFGLRKAVEDIRAAGGTVSSVGIGSDFDARLMGSLSEWGGGRTFPAVDPATLPEVVTLDTRRVVEAGREAVKRGERDPDLKPPVRKPEGKPPVRPTDRPPENPLEPPVRVALETADPCAVLEGLPPFAPAVPPQAAPAARQATTLALRFAGDGGPALVLGRHGLGRTAVLVADPADLAASLEFPAAAARLLRSLAPAAAAAPATLHSVEPAAEGTRVRIRTGPEGSGSAPIPRVELLDPAGDTPAALEVLRAGARRFEIRLPPAESGWRTLVVHGGGPADAGSPVGFFDPGPPPAAPPDAGMAARVAAASGAVLVEGDLPPPAAVRPGVPLPRPAGFWVGVLAVVLLVGDAGLRRAGRGW